ncbi:DNA-directed RNA polymerase [Kalmusia sp. IMI 367209]|nr:DNA-directed RNA polymerase [Kalmusia sp. IMI 367209]
MLARAARRKLRRDAFRSPTQLAEQLTLPWLCPAQMRWTASVGPMTTTPHDARRPRHGALSPRHETRSLATAADAQSSQMASIPFDGLMHPWSSRTQPPGLAKLELWDPSAPLILREATNPPSTPTRFGIGGDPTELYQNLHACLRVGRMDRATAIVQRLTAMYDPSAIEVVEAHNAYLQTMSDLAQQNPEPTSMAAIEEWYDANMVRRAIQPNAGTFIALLRASMTLLEGNERHRALRKYLTMAEECCDSDVMDAINYSEDFDDHEWDALIRAQPERFKQPPALEEAADIHMSTPAGQAALIEHGLIPNPAYTVRGIQQKGQGLVTLKNSLAVFDERNRVPYPHEMEGTKEEKDRAYAYMRQLQIERDATEAAVARWKVEDDKLQELGIHGVLKSKSIQSLMWQWYSALLPRIKKEYARTKEVLSAPSKDNQTDERHLYGPYLELCKPEKLAAMTVSRVIQAVAKGERDETNDLKLSALSSTIGEAIRVEANTDAMQRYVAQRKKERKLARRTLLDSLKLQPQDNKSEQTPVDKIISPPHAFLKKEIPTTIKLRLGSLMLELFLQSATITVTADDPKTGKQLSSTQAAFHHHVGFANGKRTGWIVAHHEIVSKLTKDPTHSIHSMKLPMVFEPKPWTDFDDGGYYTTPGAVVRTKLGDTSQRAYAQSAIANGDLDKVLKGLDVLGKVPWQINKDLFEVMVEAWNTGEGIGAMVPENDNLERPPEPPEDASTTERKQWAKLLQEYENTRSGYHSQRCFQNFQLELARGYVKEEKIFFPHSVDFRGRAYPVPPILNHIGSDFARGLLRFANGKELGSVGLQWLKIHLANLYGFDKASLRDREQFAMDNIHEIYDSATNPLKGRRWWTKAEDPWQFLACCMELKNALESPDPTRFVSHLPVHQDGTCNGLQHYAALGGDFAGASQVNLEPSDRPQDIYTGVAELVKGMIAEDAAKGHTLAKLLKDKVTRKVVKRTVMTNVYGELKSILVGKEEAKDLWAASSYVALRIFEALGKIFNGAQDIQYWLGECGERITTSLSAEQIRKICEHTEGKELKLDPKYKSPKHMKAAQMKKILQDIETFKTSIIWTTPLKMPVVQPYRKSGREVIRTHLQDIVVTRRNGNSAVDKRKQLQAFPPNFIHSLDATHMILSALKCSEMGLDFAAVHDSFWTHAADIPNLNVILRDAFVRMHSEDIIGRLATEFKARYAGSMYKAVLKRSSVASKKIAAWRMAQYCGGKKFAGRDNPNVYREAPLSEIALEMKRQELLNSDDPKLKEQGQQMVTPTSLWLANQDPTAFSSARAILLGETKKRTSKVDEVKEKLLTAEAEAVTEGLKASGMEPADIAQADVAAVEESDELDVDESEEASNGEVGAKKAESKFHRSNAISVWIPLTFPPVPNKGGWDVSRLRESKYFFS